MERKFDSRVWGMLTEEEKSAFSLQHAYNKSTWEAGEIVGRVHYKYLEIKLRVEKLILLFHNRLKNASSLVPDLEDKNVKLYFELVIGCRKSLKDAISEIKVPKWEKTVFRNNAILSELNKLKWSENKELEEFLEFIVEFDRWNNFRILPKEFQQPSAYKRRNKNRYKQRIKSMCNFHPTFVNHLKDSYAAKPEDKDLLLLPIIYNKHENGDIIIIPNSPFIITKLSSYGLYVFADSNTASEYFKLIMEYNFQKKKACTFGQKFWPRFRELIQLSVNNNQVENIPLKKSIEQF